MPVSGFSEFCFSGQTLVTEGKGKHIIAVKPFSVKPYFNYSDNLLTAVLKK